jgi:hypothetical protein
MKSDSSQRNKRANQREPSASAGTRWDIHADVIQRIRRHVDTNGHDHPRSRKAADTAQLWQKMAMDRIAVMLTELTSNTSAVIEQFNRNPRSFDMDAFIEYLDASADHAARLADQISSFADFGKSNGRTEDRTEISAGAFERRKREKP